MGITSMLTSAFGRAIAFLPNIFAALIILAVGLFVAAVLGRLTRRLLTAAAFERRASVRRLIGPEATLERLPTIGGRLVYWVLALVTAGVAVDALHMTWLSAGVARVLAYVPSVLAACAIVAAGYLGGNFLYRELVRRPGAPTLSARLLRGAVLALAAFMALQQLGIATAIVTIAFTVGLSAMAVAGALAFGLGNRELAGRVTRDWYERRGPRFGQYDPTGAHAREVRDQDEFRPGPGH